MSWRSDSVAVRRSTVAITLVGCILIAAGCRPSEPSSPAEPVEEATEPVAHAPAESEGLVGTDVDAEEIELIDEGPPAPLVLFTAGIKGYTEPCGCTLDLILGGIDRVTGCLRELRDIAPDVLVLDAGNLLFEYPELRDAQRAQEVRKTEVMLAALSRAGTFATTPGPTDFANGVPFYRTAMAGSEVRVISANLTHLGVPLGPGFALAPLGDLQVGIVGAADPDGLDSVPELEARAALGAVTEAVESVRAEGAEVVVLLWQGDLAAARTQLRDVTGLDFIIIGQPRNTDEVERVGSAITLEAYDQGRTVGRLKLVHGEAEAWTNARGGSNEEIARLERVIAGIEAQLAGVPENGDAPPIVVRQRERIATHRAELEQMRAATVDFSQPRTFHYVPIAMEPGLPVDDEMTEAMRRYNSELRAINAANIEPPLAVTGGMPEYVGVDACARCHPAAVDFWRSTSHSHAWETLVEREKEWDRSCVSCHATGYGAPGGSSLGHTEGLTDVQCEQCHGPGSLHAASPDVRGAPLGVVLETTAGTCTGCHNEEHSTRFDYESYRERILGPGHGG